MAAYFVTADCKRVRRGRLRSKHGKTRSSLVTADFKGFTEPDRRNMRAKEKERLRWADALQTKYSRLAAIVNENELGGPRTASDACAFRKGRF